MKLPIYFTTLLFMGMAVGPVAPQPSTPRLEPFGLEGERITALRFSPPIGLYRNNLYATTNGNGVYRHDPRRSDSLWLHLGLYDKKITALDIQVWGIGPAIFHAPVVGVAPDYDHGDSTLVYRLEENRWAAADSGINRKASVAVLSSFASSGHEPPGATFAAGGRLIYRSNSWSRWWTEIFDGGIGLSIYAMTVNQTYERNEVWVGGIAEGAIAWLAKSTDNGETWENLDLPAAVLDHHTCLSLAIHPDSSNIVYAGMYGALIKTTDGGKTWRVTGLESNRTYIYGLALDAFDPKHVYAGGVAANQWALWESFNGGTNWQEIPAPSSIRNIEGISSIVADPNTPGAIYIGTLGGGVWRYQSGIVAVQDHQEKAQPIDFALEQNYPNPFALAERGGATENNGTIIRFELPSSLADFPIRLAIYNLRGELVRELLNKKLPAGNYSIPWDGKDGAASEVASGIYLYQLRVGNRIEVRKLSLMK